MSLHLVDWEGGENCRCTRRYSQCYLHWHLWTLGWREGACMVHYCVLQRCKRELGAGDAGVQIERGLLRHCELHGMPLRWNSGGQSLTYASMSFADC